MDRLLAASPNTIRPARSWPWWRLALSGLSTLALVLSAYLGWHYLVGGSVIGCGGGSGCDQVLSSRWSAIAGVVPVSGLAAGTYLTILIASFLVGPSTAPPDRRLAWCAMLVLAGAAGGSAVWFTIVQTWVIGAFCPYCMATHITGLLLAILVIWQAPRQFRHDLNVAAPTNLPPQNVTPANVTPSNPARGPDAGGAPLRAIGRVLAGLVLAGILAACQVVFAPPPVYRGGEMQNVRPDIDPHTLPLIGSPDAPYVVTLLFDYRCPHCKDLHSMLDEVIRRYDGKVAFALCPAPLNNQCNPFISRYVEEFKDSCELARIGLAVWAANREAFAAFDRWMFSTEPDEPWHPRSLDAARARAIQLLGQANFDAALTNPWIETFMQSSIRIYGNTIDPDQSGNAVPKLVFSSRWVTPEPRDANDLAVILHESLGVPRPD